ncbi:MAG: ABC transporter substrate-binding protein [Pseudomonadota bacterium]
MKKRFTVAVLILLLIAPFPAVAATPMETMRSYIDRVLQVLRDPALKGEPGKKMKTEKIVTIADDLFDFEELSKRTLGQNWKQFSRDQQNEFVSLYKSLLKKTYSDKIISYNDEGILFGKETALSEKTSEIETTLKTQTADIPINYRLILKDGRWTAYDVIVEGISLINNYRSQFREILANKPPEGLIEVLRKKVSDNA